MGFRKLTQDPSSEDMNHLHFDCNEVFQFEYNVEAIKRILGDISGKPLSLPRILGDIFPTYHWIRDDYGNVYRVFDKKENGKWIGDIVNKRSRKRKEFRRSKKKLVWKILERHHDKKNEQYKKAHEESK